MRWVRLEIDLEDLGTHFRSLIVEVCHELAAEHNAAYGVPDPDPEAEEGTVWHYPPEAESKDDEAWESIVESLAERVLWDGDYAMSAEFIDLPPEAARAKARMWGVSSNGTENRRNGCRAAGPSTASVAVSCEPVARFGARTHTNTRPVTEQRLGRKLAATVRVGGVSWKIGRQRGR
jgi:hypothetical protein